MTDATDRRRRAGKFTMLTWFVAGMLLTVAGALGQSGSFGWLAGWQQRLFGTDDVLVSVLPGLLMVMVPMFAVEALRRRVRNPFVAGLQDGGGPADQDALRRRPAEPRGARCCGEGGCSSGSAWEPLWPPRPGAPWCSARPDGTRGKRCLSWTSPAPRRRARCCRPIPAWPAWWRRTRGPGSMTTPSAATITATLTRP